MGRCRQDWRLITPLAEEIMAQMSIVTKNSKHFGQIWYWLMGTWYVIGCDMYRVSRGRGVVGKCGQECVECVCVCL